MGAAISSIAIVGSEQSANQTNMRTRATAYRGFCGGFVGNRVLNTRVRNLHTVPAANLFRTWSPAHSRFQWVTLLEAEWCLTLCGG